ncbi:HU family DNA-binding protein [uncultured Meiothermus sp.]|jgi:DNA-binding protein HU-beta|uniref:HU family DNA-binding protein n=1 Tax=uncultured Meiothermus sp. TaxID=157471 RepID=UPI003453F3EF
MTKTDLVEAVAAQTGLRKLAAHAAIEALLLSIQAALADGQAVSLPGFGSLELADRKERLGVRPGTSEPIIIPAKRVVVFRAAKALKDAVR